MAAGRRFGKRAQKKVARAVDLAEDYTGLQICVYLGPVRDDPRVHAESLFAAAGLDARPAVLLLVAPEEHRVEMVTAPEVGDRLPDAACARCIEVMTPLFAAGEMGAGLVEGVRRIAQEAGPGTARAGDEELPDLLDGYE